MQTISTARRTLKQIIFQKLGHFGEILNDGKKERNEVKKKKKILSALREIHI